MRSIRSVVFAFAIAMLTVTAGAHIFSALAFAQRAQIPGEKRPLKQLVHKEKLTPEQRVEQRLNALKRDLTLTKDQESKIREILMNKADRKLARQSAVTGNAEQKKALVEQMLSERKATQDSILQVLTPEQRTKYETKPHSRYWHFKHKQ
jgi:Spy/CpxP family protein refolding chaperone